MFQRPGALALRVLPLAAVALAAACDSSGTTEPAIDPRAFRTDSVDAAGSWSYVSLANPGQPITLTLAQAAASSAWDLGFNGFNTEVNSGETGPGGATVFCICQNTRNAPSGPAAAAYYSAMTPESELADFQNVTATNIPADTAFRADTLAAIRNWFAVGAAGARTVQPYVYAVSLPNNAGFAKFQVVSIENPTGAVPGRVTFQYAVTPNARTTPFGPAQTATVNVTSATAPIAFSFASNGPVDATGGTWDVRFEGWRIRTNSGGRATAQTPGLGAYNITTELGSRATFAEVGLNLITTQAQAYQQDGSGLFDTQPTWFYDSPSRRAFPTFDVYLVKRGSSVYKVQVIRHPVTNGQTFLSRFVLFRSAKIAG